MHAHISFIEGKGELPVAQKCTKFNSIAHLCYV